MSATSLYQDDILLWSEQQAEVIRSLGRTRRDLPNELDIQNVAEEIESVGRSELAAVESFLRLLMVHLIKLATAPDSPAALHWRDEARNFAVEARARFAPSMAQRLDLERVWKTASYQALSSITDHGDPAPAHPDQCPWSLDELLQDEPDLDDLTAALGRGSQDQV